MQKTLPLYLGPSVIGSVIIDGDEHRLTVFAKTYATLDGICRAYITSEAGRLLVGVLSPDGSAYSAKRTFTRESLASSGIIPDEISYAYTEAKEASPRDSEDSWQNAEKLSEYAAGNKILSALAKSTGAKVNSLKNPTRLAVPLFTGRPFPRPDVLCLITPCRINGEMFGVIGINEKGEPEKL